MTVSAYEVLSSERPFQGAVTTVRVDSLRAPDGSEVEREVVEQDDAVAVVALTDEREVVLLRQYRHPMRGYVLELPAGKLDKDGEARAEAMHRELAEETRLQVGELTELLTFANSSGWTDEHTTVYLAQGVERASRPDDFTAEAEEADLEVVRMPLDEAVAQVEAGEIIDAKTVIGLLLAARRFG